MLLVHEFKVCLERKEKEKILKSFMYLIHVIYLLFKLYLEYKKW